MFSALATQTCCNSGNRKSGSTTPMIYLLMLPVIPTHCPEVGALNAGTFNIIHCPAMRDKRDTKFPL